MKTYAPKGLHGAQLRAILEALQATPAQVSKFLQVTERSVWRWLADDSAPFPVLAALWHETPAGRHATALDVGNELAIHRGMAVAQGQALAVESARLARLVAIADTGAANDPLLSGPFTENPRPAWEVCQSEIAPARLLSAPPPPAHEALQGLP